MDIDKLSEQELLALRERIDRRVRDLQAARSAGFEPGGRMELVVLAVKYAAARCRDLQGGAVYTLRAGRLYKACEGHILTVKAKRLWRYGRIVYLNADIEKVRLDIPALKLKPLELGDEEPWDPAEECWGDPGESVHEKVVPVIAAGPRPSYVMEQILPGYDPEDPGSDPIGRAVDLMEAGDEEQSRKVLQQCLEVDLRVLDAHAHLGLWRFGDGTNSVSVEDAERHYRVGVEIGELSLGPGFKGLLSWERLDNRPFLRCLHGLATCRWARGDRKAAAELLRRMLWLSPRDAQGARFDLAAVEAGKPYSPR